MRRQPPTPLALGDLQGTDCRPSAGDPVPDAHEPERQGPLPQVLRGEGLADQREVAVPSYEAPKEASKEAKAADKAAGGSELIHATKARMLVECADCLKKRVVYSKKDLTANERSIAQARIDVTMYVCGATGLFDGSVLEGKAHVQHALVCGMPVEKQYYSSKQFPACCTHCSETEARFVDAAELNLQGKKAYPICDLCVAKGLDRVTYGKADKTGGKSVQNKGGKRRTEGERQEKKKPKRIIDSSDEEAEVGEEADEEGDSERGEESEGEEGQARQHTRRRPCPHACVRQHARS